LREVRRLRVFENGVLKKISGAKRDEATVESRRLHNGEPDDLYFSPNLFRETKSGRMRWVGHVARTMEGTGACGALVGRPEGKRPLGRSRCRWNDNIKMNLEEVR
jgi:hypothetical protein